ncbi:profilin, required for normal timing of actin polymerization in response to thermal stress [Actinomortierella ambigua]|uniref:Profilin n=1 Tax=Actinomortierella ambigua TaxID=1343610 RepID=A0A9P6Q1Q3_9FUNG|nr:profilin, required for normal timing of actin polymerization in response to thermal stress [Actinomortierella ambigua]KAG0256601.1 profilin, required for normal timing of actin polymerization in response to thermal stress [Actinomortierella ambigua]
MSWQAYVDDNLVGTGKVSKAGIYGLDGTKWASSAGYEPSGEEVKALIAGIKDPSTLYANGVYLEGTKHVVLRTTPGESVYVRKDNTGATVVMTNQCILVGHFDENTQPGPSTVVVEGLADYLKGVGY